MSSSASYCECVWFLPLAFTSNDRMFRNVAFFGDIWRWSEGNFSQGTDVTEWENRTAD